MQSKRPAGDQDPVGENFAYAVAVPLVPWLGLACYGRIPSTRSTCRYEEEADGGTKAIPTTRSNVDPDGIRTASGSGWQLGGEYCTVQSGIGSLRTVSVLHQKSPNMP